MVFDCNMFQLMIYTRWIKQLHYELDPDNYNALTLPILKFIQIKYNLFVTGIKHTDSPHNKLTMLSREMSLRNI